MPHIDPDAITTLLEIGEVSAQLIDTVAPEAASVPQRWRGIADSVEPSERAAVALSLWNRDFLDLVPRFAHVLESALVDVRPCYWQGPSGAEIVLVYIVSSPGESLAVWVGWDPALFGDHRPTLWDSLPMQARTFLQEVHAGFTLPDGETCGLTRPRFMYSLAEWSGWPEGIPEWEGNWWEDCEPVDSRRLLRITGNGSDFDLCTSPDLPAGTGLASSSGHLQVVRQGTRRINDAAGELLTTRRNLICNGSTVSPGKSSRSRRALPS
ncbi:hypothetical protein ACQP1G_16570 [Nocardia sp. CA-107356]|uniref:hypothetical protein n=1 Tax=Nocardia sp. CA-107356 TaxID=3239972 RepID=UPI003D903BBE